MLSRNVADNILILYYYFSEKIRLGFSWRFTWKAKSYFSLKKEDNNNTWMLSAAVKISILRVNVYTTVSYVNMPKIYKEQLICITYPTYLIYLNPQCANHNCSRRQFLLFFYLGFQIKQVLTFHVNHLLGRWFTWNVKTCFLWKIKKKKFRMSSATNFAWRFKG